MIMNKYDLPLVMLGDFNSRIGILDDFISVGNVDKDIFIQLNDNCISKDYFDSISIPSKGYSVDTKINKNGKKLTELCQCLKKVNGRLSEE